MTVLRDLAISADVFAIAAFCVVDRGVGIFADEAANGPGSGISAYWLVMRDAAFDSVVRFDRGSGTVSGWLVFFRFLETATYNVMDEVAEEAWLGS